MLEGYDNRGMRLPHVIVRYEFDGDLHPIKGNAMEMQRKARGVTTAVSQAL